MATNVESISDALRHEAAALLSRTTIATGVDVVRGIDAVAQKTIPNPQQCPRIWVDVLDPGDVRANSSSTVTGTVGLELAVWFAHHGKEAEALTRGRSLMSQAIRAVRADARFGRAFGINAPAATFDDPRLVSDDNYACFAYVTKMNFTFFCREDQI